MFIDYIMTMCDQILRRAAEEYPGSTCLQNIPAHNKDKENQTRSIGGAGETWN